MDFPDPALVGKAFVKQYYTQMHRDPTQMHRFYLEQSSFVHGGADIGSEEPVLGQKAIHEKIISLELRQVHAKIKQVDSHSTLESGIVIQVTGELSTGGHPMRAFVQTFVLAPESPKKYYVHNDIFRYQDDDLMSESETNEGLGEVENATVSDPVQEEADFRPSSTEMLKDEGSIYVSQPGELVAMTEQNHPDPTSSVATGGPVGAWDQPFEESTPLQQNGLPQDGEDQQPTPQEFPVASPPHLYGEGEEVHVGVGEQEGEGEADNFPSVETQEPAIKGTWASRLATKPQSYSNPAPKQPPPTSQPPGQSRPMNNMAGPLPQREPRTRRDDAPRHGPKDAPKTGREAPDSYQIFVGGLPQNTSESDLRSIFSEYGKIIEVRVNPKNFAFVVFSGEEPVQRVIKEKVTFRSKILNIEQKRPSMPRSGGSGRNKMGTGPAGNSKIPRDRKVPKR